MSTPDETVRQSEDDLRHSKSLSREAPEIEGYELDSLLGAGAFGVVWSASQLRTGQRVALKILKPQTRNWAYVCHELRKLREISKHPFVVSLLDADLDHDPPYFAMPLLTQGSLAEADPVLEEVEPWLEQIAEALCFMHGKGLLHCDLKPSNVLLDDEGRCRVVDFGQARAQGEQDGAFGTLGFMPPEQAHAGTAPGTAWDVYGFGATAYYMLTGQCPRLSEQARSELTDTRTAEERLSAYREVLGNSALVPLRTLNPKVDADLAAIVENCLKLDPKLRAASMHQVAEDLERRKDKAPLLCQKPWSVRYRINRFLARPLVAILLCAAVLFPLFINTYLTVHGQMALGERVRAEVASVNEVVARRATPETLASLRTQDFQHHLLKGDTVFASTASPSPQRISLDALSVETGRPDGGFYERDGVELVGAWRKVGDLMLLSERPTAFVMKSSRYLLMKNWMLNLLGLLIAIFTIIALLKPRR